jgi:hypothetical protein
MPKRKTQDSAAGDTTLANTQAHVEGLDKVLPPLKDLNQSAKHYFNHLYFFKNEADRREFEIRFDSMVDDDKEKKYLLESLEAFFQRAQKREKNNVNALEGAMDFLGDCIHGCKFDRVREAYKTWKEKQEEVTRMVSVDFEIAKRKLSHFHDLERFTDALEDVFKWFDEDGVSMKKRDVVSPPKKRRRVFPSKKERRASPPKKMLGPYLCFVQSSGMGKTKLMYEYRENSFRVESDIASSLILSSRIRTSKKRSGVFDFREDFRKEIGSLSSGIVAAIRIYEVLDMILKKTLANNKVHRNRAKDKKGAPQEINECNRVVLMFDESQSLLRRDFGYDAFLFRCVRVWLREKRDEKVIAVFAGTTSKITNFLIESDKELEPGLVSSRAIQKGEEMRYHEKGSNQIYPPFYHTATMGSCLPLVAGITEYERATYYGRPLFAIMASKEALHKKISNILCRMLIVPQGHDWKSDLKAVMNILATRVQLGETSVDVVSELVAKAYATLSGCSEDSRTLKMAYLPDPVCARLAMCMMDKNFKQVVPDWKTTIKGKKKEWWTRKLKDIFSTGLVRPAKGDFGEVVVALYMLFCGDLLRKEIRDSQKEEDKEMLDYSHFSVSLDAWLDLLESGGEPAEGKYFANCELSVGFIQVCRNSLRSYRTSWNSLKNESFLQRIFESGVAFYTFEGCPLIDMVVPLRVNNSAASHKYRFVPLMISIKCELEFDQANAEAVCEAMKKKAMNSGLKSALCLLIVFGSKPPYSSYAGEIAIGYGTHKVSRQLLARNGRVIAKAVRVPTNDQFQLTDAFLQMTPDSQVNSELFSSHSFIMAHGGDDSKDLLAENAVCATSRTGWKKKYEFLRKAVTNRTQEESA